MLLAIKMPMREIARAIGVSASTHDCYSPAPAPKWIAVDAEVNA